MVAIISNSYIILIKILKNIIFGIWNEKTFQKLLNTIADPTMNKNTRKM